MLLSLLLVPGALAAVPKGWVRRADTRCTTVFKNDEGKEWGTEGVNAAIAKCQEMDDCVALQDWGCDGGVFKLCMKANGKQPTVGKEDICAYLKPGTEDEVCHDITGLDECFINVKYAMEDGRVNNPQWYSDWAKWQDRDVSLADATVQDFQMYFHCKPWFAERKHNCGAPVCGRTCPKQDANQKPTPKPTNKPENKPLVTINPRTGYGRRAGTVCWKPNQITGDEVDDEGNPKPLIFYNGDRAAQECDKREDCAFISDYECDGRGGLTLCKAGKASSHKESCIYMKKGIRQMDCHRVNEMDDCFVDINWAMNNGRKNHPEWYGDFKKYVPDVELADAGIADMQMYFYCHPNFPEDDPEKRQNCGLPACNRSCPEQPEEKQSYAVKSWSRREGLFCWAANRLKDDQGEELKPKTMKDAVALCEQRDDCTAVTDWNCDGKGELRLCGKAKLTSANAKNHCAYVKKGEEQAACHDINEFDDCYQDVTWAMDTGMKENPQWYQSYKNYVDNAPDSLDDMTIQDVQMYFHCHPNFEDKKQRCNAGPCGRTCPEVSPQAEPTKKPDTSEAVFPKVSDGYGRKNKVICWKDSRLKNDEGQPMLLKLDEAMDICDKDDRCAGLADFDCDGKGLWALCEKGKPMASAAQHCTYKKDDGSEDFCHEVSAQDDCYRDIIWTMDTGRNTKPEWYKDFNKYVPNVALKDANALDFQMFFYCHPNYDDKRHNCGLPVCGRECPSGEEPKDKPFEFPRRDGWNRRASLTCGPNNRIMSEKKNDKGELIPVYINDAQAAMDECSKRDDCQSITDWQCDGKGSYVMCKEASKMVGNKMSCAYVDSRYADEVCHDVNEMDDCWSDIQWSLDTYKVKPDTFKTLEKFTGKTTDDELTAQDFQLLFHCNKWFKENGKSHFCGAAPCGRSCPDVEAPKPTAKPTPAPKQKVDYNGWGRRKNLYCFGARRMKTEEVDENGKPKDLIYRDLNDAIIRCSQEETCIGVSDWECDDAGLFFLCTDSSRPTTRAGDCIYFKPEKNKDELICHDADPRDDCFGDVNWALTTGRNENPEWYKTFNDYVPDKELKDATFQDMQMYFYCHPDFGDKQANCGAPVCGRKCGGKSFLTTPKGYVRRSKFYCNADNQLKDDEGNVLKYPGVYAAAAACNERNDCAGLADWDCDLGTIRLCMVGGLLTNNRDSCVYGKESLDSVAKCHDVTPLDECYVDVTFAFTTGRKNRPEWYEDIEEYTGVALKDASIQTFQAYFFCKGDFKNQRHNCGYMPCGMECVKDDNGKNPQPTPKPVIPQSPSNHKWGRKMGVACWLGNQIMSDKKDDKGEWIPLRFNKVDEAVTECEDRGDDCAAVFDFGCDGKGQFMLCKEADKIASKEGQCVYMKPDEEKNMCHTANNLDDCWSHIKWTKDDGKGIKNNDEHGWYNDFNDFVANVALADASYEDIQLYFFCKHEDKPEMERNCGLPPCGRQCRPKPQLPTEEGWLRKQKRMCWAGNWIKTGQKDKEGKDIAYTYDDIDEAMKACTQMGKDTCSGVTDWACDARGPYKLCGSGNHVIKNVDNHCVWVHETFEEEKCHDISPLDTCYPHVVWALREGKKSNPEWYGEFKEYTGTDLADGNADDFQTYFACHPLKDGAKTDCGAPPCGRECPEVSPVVAPTEKPVAEVVILPNVKDYGRRHNLFCPANMRIKDGKGEDLKYKDVKEAVSECDKRDECMAVSDWNCDGKPFFMLCNSLDFNNVKGSCMYVPHDKDEQVCHDVMDMDECYGHITWALNTGLKNNPDWYKDWNKYVPSVKIEDASKASMQMYFHCKHGQKAEEKASDCGAPACGMKCPEEDKPVDPTPKPTDKPADNDDTCWPLNKEKNCSRRVGCKWEDEVCMVDNNAKKPEGKDLTKFCKSLKESKELCNGARWKSCAWDDDKKKCGVYVKSCGTVPDMKFKAVKSEKLDKVKDEGDCGCKDRCADYADENPGKNYVAFLYTKKGDCSCVAAKKLPKEGKPTVLGTKKKNGNMAGVIFDGDNVQFGK